jgi:perosamine synthetase
MMNIPLSRPDITDAERDEVMRVLGGPVLSLGPRVPEFEGLVARYVGVKHAIAVSSGTSGLHLVVRGMGWMDGVEIITTPFTFVATVNVLLLERAHPVFVDIDPVTLNLHPTAVRSLIEREYRRDGGRMINRSTGRPLAGVLPVDVYGHPIMLDEFRVLADEYGLRILDDTCESLGSEYLSKTHDRWVKSGTIADAAVFAFYPNKQMTTAEGGIIVTDDDALATYCRAARNQGRAEGSGWLQHDVLGFNYRMDELSAALGVAQMRRFEELAAKRARVAAWYDEALADVPGVVRPGTAPWAKVNWFVYVVRVDRGIDRDAVIDALGRRGVASKPYFPPVHLQPYLRGIAPPEGSLPVAEEAGRRAIALPFYNDLSKAEVRHIANALREGVKSGVSVSS